MSSFILILCFTLFLGTNAIPWHAAKQTATYKADEWSPRPTNTISEPRDLFKRGSIDVDVCGWIGGNLAQPVGCGSGSSCIHDTSFGFVGCCPTSSAGADPIPCTDGLYTTCVDHNSVGYTSDSFLINNGILSCPASSNCYKIIYPQNYIQFGCGPSAGNVTAATTFAGQATDLNLQIVYTGVSFDPTITIQNPSNFGVATSFPTFTTGTPTQSTASEVAGKGSLTPTVPESPTSAVEISKGSTDTSAIIGGTLGALVVIIGACLTVFFLIRKRENKWESRAPHEDSSPNWPSKAAFESVPNTAPSPQPIHSPVPFTEHSPQPHDHYSQMGVINNLGYAPAFQFSSHRPTTPAGHHEPVEAPTPDLCPRNFHPSSPMPDPFQPPHSEILPESYDPSRPRGPPSSEPYHPSQSPESQNWSPELQQYHHPSSPEPQPLRPRPSRSPPPTITTQAAAPTTNPYSLPRTADLPPLDIMEDIQTPIVPKPAQANWHLALTGDRRTYAPADGLSTSFHHHHEPVPAMPVLYADITNAMGAESISPPKDSFLMRQNSNATKPGMRRNFSRKGRAERQGMEIQNDEYEDVEAMSNNIRQSGWVPSGLRTRNSPSPHSVHRMPNQCLVGNNEGAAQRYQMADLSGEEVRIAYNPNAGLNMGHVGPPRVVGIGRQPSPVIDPNAVEGGWL